MTLVSPGRRPVVVVALFLGGVLAGGCGPKTGSLTGKVIYKGQPVTSGQVSLLCSDHVAKYSELREDGTFTFNDLAVGECKVAVASPGPGGEKSKRDLGADRGEGAPGREDTPVVMSEQQKKTWRALPQKYLLHTTSGVTVTVGAGKTEKNIDLPD